MKQFKLVLILRRNRENTLNESHLDTRQPAAGNGFRHRAGQSHLSSLWRRIILYRALNHMLNGLILHQPVLCIYHHRLKQSKPVGVARVATIRRAIGILWATLREQRADTPILQGETEMI